MVSKEVVETRVKEMVAKHAINLSEVTGETRLREDAFIDSLEIVQLQMSIEDEFNIEIDESAIDRITTVQQLIGLVLSTDLRKKIDELRAERRIAEMGDDYFVTNGSARKFDERITALENELRNVLDPSAA